ncbi:MAG: hypothetical protein Q8Q23_05120 [bacterium]|nr:hypothetical protein [bacterium]
MVSPSVYGSTNNAIVENNKSKQEFSKSQQLNQQLLRERALARNKYALGEINGSTETIKINELVSTNGLIGGVPVIFVNDSRRSKNITVTSVNSYMFGYKWNFLLPEKGYREFKLEVGEYWIEWTSEYSNQVYPREKPDEFFVTLDPHYWHDQTQKNYHGGYRIYGY